MGDDASFMVNHPFYRTTAYLSAIYHLLCLSFLLIMVESSILLKKRSGGYSLILLLLHTLTGEAALIYVYQHLVVEKPKPQRALKNNAMNKGAGMEA